MNDLAQIVSTVGFPIFSFLISAYFIKYTYDKTQEEHKLSMEKIGSLADAVNHNSEVLLQLVTEVKDMNDNINHKDKEDNK